MTSGPGPRNDAYAPRAVRLLLFASAREAAGTREVGLTASTVGEVLELARARFGAGFSSVLEGSRVWVNGEPARPEALLSDGDEVAVLPPVSGG
jgi:MoaD family protein